MYKVQITRCRKLLPKTDTDNHSPNDRTNSLLYNAKTFPHRKNMNIIYVLITPVGSAAKNVQTRTGREGMISKKVKSLRREGATLKSSAAQETLKQYNNLIQQYTAVKSNKRVKAGTDGH